MKGKFYSGKLCLREIQEMELEEASIVENPASKMNRILTTTFNGKTVDVFTLTQKKTTANTRYKQFGHLA
jgi:hypothetical protein